MDEEPIETVEGYKEYRDPDTAVFIQKGVTGNKYHEVNERGRPLCGNAALESCKKVSLQKAIRNWHEPCKSDPCSNRRKDESKEFDDSVGPNNGSIIAEFTEDDIYSLYWGEMLSTGMIAERFNLHSYSVLKFMRNRGIPRRTESEASKVTSMRNRGDPSNKEIVEELFGGGANYR